MEFIFRRSYRGPIKGVILDWAGTTVDYGCFAPVAAFQAVFAQRGVAITLSQARGPMGLMKRDHIAAIAALPEVAAAWQAAQGRACTDADVGEMFASFVPLQLARLPQHATPIPGVVEAVAELRARGLKIGSTTGYTREMMQVLVPAAQAQGYAPDHWVCPSDVPAGRPWPWMCYENAMALSAFPLEAWVKIGDTLADIEEGLNAGMWTIGLSLTGNEMGLTEAEVAALEPAQRQARLQAIRARMLQAGAHHVVDGLADCLPAIDDLQQRVARGERP
jgi:phosphonoacetaldehyde hydrolase